MHTERGEKLILLIYWLSKDITVLVLGSSKFD